MVKYFVVKLSIVTFLLVTVNRSLQLGQSSASSSSCQRICVSAARIFSNSIWKAMEYKWNVRFSIVSIAWTNKKLYSMYCCLTCNDCDKRTKSFCTASLLPSSCCRTPTLFLNSDICRSDFSCQLNFFEYILISKNPFIALPIRVLSQRRKKVLDTYI